MIQKELSFLVGLLIYSLFIFPSCHSVSSFNKSIHQEQLKSMAKMRGTFNSQKKIRDQVLLHINRIQKKYPNEVIIMVESYSDDCVKCPSNDILVYVDYTVISIKKNTNGDFVKNKTINLDQNFIGEGQHFADFSTLIKMINDPNLSSMPRQLGNKDCLGELGTIYTIISPNKNVHAIYTRCWFPNVTPNS